MTLCVYDATGGHVGVRVGGHVGVGVGGHIRVGVGGQDGGKEDQVETLQDPAQRDGGAFRCCQRAGMGFRPVRDGKRGWALPGAGPGQEMALSSVVGTQRSRQPDERKVTPLSSKSLGLR